MDTLCKATHNKDGMCWKGLTTLTTYSYVCSRASLPYFTTHMELVRRQQEAISARKAVKTGLTGDQDWTGDGFVAETETMVSNV